MDLVTLVQLKLPPLDLRFYSTAQLYQALEAEIRSWAIAKPILAARKFRGDGTRGIRIGDIADLHRSLVDRTMGTGPRDSSRELRLVARASHTLINSDGQWDCILGPRS